MESSIISKFADFALNYHSFFCFRIWGVQSPHLANHFNDKFNEYHDRYGAYGAMLAFYKSLDASNTKIFENYLMNQYGAE